MDLNQIFNQLNSGNFLSLTIKLFSIVGVFIYLCFAIVLIKQVKVMKKAIEIKDGGLLLLASYIQLILAIILVFYSLFIL
jgi:hypothetical protein